MKAIRTFTLTLMVVWLSACSERDDSTIALIDPVVTEVLVERGDWIIVQHTSTNGTTEDISYSFNRVGGDGTLRVFQCFSGGPKDGWHIHDLGKVQTSSAALHPDARKSSWSELTQAEQANIQRLLSQLDDRLSQS